MTSFFVTLVTLVVSICFIKLFYTASFGTEWTVSACFRELIGTIEQTWHEPGRFYGDKRNFFFGGGR